MNGIRWIGFGLAFVFVIGLLGCSIEETEEPSLGAIGVRAVDTTASEPILGGTVKLNGVPQTGGTPLVVDGLKAGEYTIELRPGRGYPPRETNAAVFPPDTTTVVFTFASPDTSSEYNGTVTVTVDQPDARIIVDEQFISVTPPAPVLLPPGGYTMSALVPGYRTLEPSLVSLDIIAGEFYDISFSFEEAVTGPRLDQLAPDFLLPTDAGDTLSLGQFRGRVVLVNFWFFNCPPCREEFPALEQVFQQRAEEGFRLLSVNTGWYNDGPEEFATIREELGLSFPLLFNTGQVDMSYEVVQAPTNFLIDGGGIIRDRFGATTTDDLNDKLDGLLP